MGRDLTILMEIVRSLFCSGAFVPGEVVCQQISSRARCRETPGMIIMEENKRQEGKRAYGSGAGAAGGEEPDFEADIISLAGSGSG